MGCASIRCIRAARTTWVVRTRKDAVLLGYSSLCREEINIAVRVMNKAVNDDATAASPVPCFFKSEQDGLRGQAQQ